MSLDEVGRNAVRFKSGFEQELLRVTIHSVLHLLAMMTPALNRGRGCDRKRTGISAFLVPVFHQLKRGVRYEYAGNGFCSLPFCGEPMDLEIDCGAGSQEYTEDCPVCCKPVSVSVRISDGELPWWRSALRMAE